MRPPLTRRRLLGVAGGSLLGGYLLGPRVGGSDHVDPAVDDDWLHPRADSRNVASTADPGPGGDGRIEWEHTLEKRRVDDTNTPGSRSSTTHYLCPPITRCGHLTPKLALRAGSMHISGHQRDTTNRHSSIRSHRFATASSIWCFRRPSVRSTSRHDGSAGVTI
ncbi:hypothetical protein C495_02430 [Natronorubrum sulfidifaciens JCM 14089]|uniref:Uncharacterized protein n=1 Tax=Natronorubrum sulfidifaciens JCM 14089 TaxID=1230460 RepID=L9WFR0_9EURY|nr:hypothetical protein C495_02430 [Natronorubrum sulfidifaciens JCM 14089]